MSAGEERSASGGGGWTNLDRVFVLSSSSFFTGPVQMLSFSGSDQIFQISLFFLHFHDVAKRPQAIYQPVV